MTNRPKSPETGESFLLPSLCEYRALLILIIVAELVVLMLVLARQGLHFDWTGFGLVTIYVQWQAIGSAALLCQMRGYLSRMSKYRAATLAYFLLLGVGLLLAVLVEWQFRPPGKPGFAWHDVLRNLVLTAILGGIALRYLYVQQQLVNREKSELLANLSALQARIKPHFLFNTMNSIASLISIDPEKAEKMVEDLAELLRASLRDHVVETPIAEEWHICEKYLEIEKLRLGERLRWECDFSALDQNLPIPSLALQPLVENAIYHGIQPSPEGGYLKVTGRSQGGEVEIRVENSQTKREGTQRSNHGNRMAINNIRHRIQHLYGETALLELRDLGTTFLVTLRYRIALAPQR
jgi:two-component system sensor histidine kinase AlgZ